PGLSAARCRATHLTPGLGPPPFDRSWVDDVDEWSLLSAPLQDPVDIRHAVVSHLWTREALVADGGYPQVATGERVLLLGIPGDSLVLGERDPAGLIRVTDPFDILHFLLATGVDLGHGVHDMAIARIAPATTMRPRLRSKKNSGGG